MKRHKIRTKFEERVKELVDVEASNLKNLFKDGVLKACDKLCGRRMIRMDRGNTCWRNKDVKTAIDKKSI